MAGGTLPGRGRGQGDPLGNTSRDKYSPLVAMIAFFNLIGWFVGLFGGCLGGGFGLLVGCVGWVRSGFVGLCWFVLGLVGLSS